VFAATTRRSAVTKTAGAVTERRIASRSGSRWDMRMSTPATPRNSRSPSPVLSNPVLSNTGAVIVITYRFAQEKST
jgi:hypothetical protein